MDGQAAAVLFGAGLAGGIVTAVVGGASLITFPAMLAAGLPAIVANASNSVAMTPANLVGGLADFKRVPRWDRGLAGLGVVSVTGSMAGAVLLLLTPEKAFTAVVPVLIGLATVLFAASDRIRRWLAAPARTRLSSHRVGILLFAPVAVYGGYFGAGMSVMLLAILSASRAEDFASNNVVKNLLSALTGIVAVAIFVVQGIVAWSPTIVMMSGGLVGGFLGGRLAGRVPAALVRTLVVGVGTVLTVVYAWRYWR
jgi:uncharacterized protein